MLNIVFAGTPPFAATILADLINSEHNIIAAFTQPDRPKGRGRKMMPSAVKALAENNNIPVHQPLSLKTPEAFNTLKALGADVIVVVAYGLILPQNILDLPRFGCLNVHASLLPAWRGAAPIQHAILKQDEKTGVVIMQMDAGLDTGDMLVTKEYALSSQDTLQRVEDNLAPLGSTALLETLTLCETNKLSPVKQDDAHASYAHKITKADTLLHWHHTAKELDARIRAFNPRPVAHTLLGDMLIKIHEATVLDESNSGAPGTIISVSKKGIDVATQGGSLLRLLTLQVPGGKPLQAVDILNGKADLFVPGAQFTS